MMNALFSPGRIIPILFAKVALPAGYPQGHFDMLSLDSDSIMAFLHEEGYAPEKQPETGQVYFIKKVASRDFPIFIKSREGLLQLIAFLPLHIKEGAQNDLARFLHHLNRNLDVPGFFMDEQNSLVFYRFVLPAFDGKAEKKTVRLLLKSLEHICHLLGETVMNVAAGRLTLSQALEISKRLLNGS